MGSQHGDLGRGGGGVCGEGLFAWEGAPESNTGLVWAGFRFQDSSASVRRLGFLQGRWPDPEPQQEPPERVSDSGAVEAGALWEAGVRFSGPGSSSTAPPRGSVGPSRETQKNHSAATSHFKRKRPFYLCAKIRRPGTLTCV